MLNNYIYPKNKYPKHEVSFMYMFFENGDFLEIKCNEIINLSINVYDKLIRSHQGYNPVIESGYIKLKICNKSSFTNSKHFLYNEIDYIKNRKSYIENRCVNESKITQLWLFDNNHWHKVLHCNADAKMDGNFLILEFLKQPQMGPFTDSKHYINTNNLTKTDIFRIDLDFENCEDFVIFQDEIEEINIEFSNELEWNAGSLCRKAVGGYIKIKLDDVYLPRKNTLFSEKKYLNNKDFEKRLCGKKGEAIHDICHLYIDYYHAGFGTQISECICIDDMLSDEEISKLEDKDNNNDNLLYFFQGGVCKKLKDKSIVITFGKNCKDTINQFIK